MTDEPMPHLTMASHRGHSLHRTTDGTWGCSCGKLTLPASTEDPQAFAAFVDHAGDAQWQIWDDEAQRYISESEIREAVKQLGPMQLRLPPDFLEQL